MPVVLTQKMEGFALDIVKDIFENQAYKNNYSTENMTENAISVEACRLRASPKISLRIAELRLPAAQAVIATRDELGEGYTEIFRKEATETKDKVSVGKELSQLYGYYSPNKTDHTFNGEGLVEVLGKLRGYKQVEDKMPQIRSRSDINDNSRSDTDAH